MQVTLSKRLVQPCVVLFLLSCLVTFYITAGSNRLIMFCGSSAKIFKATTDVLRPVQFMGSDRHFSFGTTVTEIISRDLKPSNDEKAIPAFTRIANDSRLVLRQTYLNYRSGVPLKPAVCTNNKTWIVIMILSRPDSFRTRQIIRTTWARGDIERAWNYGDSRIGLSKYQLRRIFVVGKPSRRTYQHALDRESRVYRDILQFELVDSYRNLSLKVLNGLRWISTICPKALHVIKSDDDMFIHIPRLLFLLERNNVSSAMVGHVIHNGKVQRHGQWAVQKKLLPQNTYPSYTSGNAYVVPGHLLPGLINASRYNYPIPVEDAYVTGVLRKSLGVKVCSAAGFARWRAPLPHVCDIISGNVVSATRMTSRQITKTWKAYQSKLCLNRVIRTKINTSLSCFV